MGHELAEQVSGLASRVNNLSRLQDQDDSLALLRIQNALIDQSSQAIVARLNAQQADYQAALTAIQGAIGVIGNGERRIEKIATVIATLEKVLDLVEKALEKAAM